MDFGIPKILDPIPCGYQGMIVHCPFFFCIISLIHRLIYVLTINPLSALFDTLLSVNSSLKFCSWHFPTSDKDSFSWTIQRIPARDPFVQRCGSPSSKETAAGLPWLSLDKQGLLSSAILTLRGSSGLPIVKFEFPPITHEEIQEKSSQAGEPEGLLTETGPTRPTASLFYVHKPA